MKAMILAAGEGRRLRPHTLTTPKPLLHIRGKALIEYHLDDLAQAGFREVIINVAYLGQKIMDALEDGSRWGLSIQYSVEPKPLETGGALVHARTLLGDAPFLLVNGDVKTDFPFDRLKTKSLAQHQLAHLVLVSNPEHHLSGDFSFTQQDLLQFGGDEAFTFSGISLINPAVLFSCPACRSEFPLREAFSWGCESLKVTGERYTGAWTDVGTPERLEQLNAQ